MLAQKYEEEGLFSKDAQFYTMGTEQNKAEICFEKILRLESSFESYLEYGDFLLLYGLFEKAKSAYYKSLTHGVN